MIDLRLMVDRECREDLAKRLEIFVFKIQCVLFDWTIINMKVLKCNKKFFFKTVLLICSVNEYMRTDYTHWGPIAIFYIGRFENHHSDGQTWFWEISPGLWPKSLWFWIWLLKEFWRGKNFYRDRGKLWDRETLKVMYFNRFPLSTKFLVWFVMLKLVTFSLRSFYPWFFLCECVIWIA